MIIQLHNARHYCETCEILTLKAIENTPSAQEFPEFYPDKEGISRKLISKIFLQSFLDVEHMYIQHMASKKGNWISADHTFKVQLIIMLIYLLPRKLYQDEPEVTINHSTLH